MTSARILVDEGTSALVALTRFNGHEVDAAVRLLQPCCPGRRWVNEVVSGRPYASMRAILIASDDVLADLSWSEVAAALLAHPTDDVDALRAVLRSPTPSERAELRASLCRLVRMSLISTLR